MSDMPLEDVRDRIEAMARAAHEIGAHAARPADDHVFLALPVIPELKLTDKGLVDVDQIPARAAIRRVRPASSKPATGVVAATGGRG